jgi:hypothetical protein
MDVVNNLAHSMMNSSRVIDNINNIQSKGNNESKEVIEDEHESDAMDTDSDTDTKNVAYGDRKKSSVFEFYVDEGSDEEPGGREDMDEESLGVSEEDEAADTFTLGPTLRRGYEGMYFESLQKVVRKIARHAKSRASTAPICEHPEIVASFRGTVVAVIDYETGVQEQKLKEVEEKAGPYFEIERREEGGFRLLYR